MQQERLWSGSFVVAMLINLVFGIVFYLLMTTMALYAVERFAAADSLAGFASSGFVLGAVVSRVFAGRFIDLLGRRRTILIALVGFLLAAVAYFVVDSLWLLIVLRLLHGVAFGAGQSAVTTVAMALIPSHRRAEGTGYFGVSSTFSAALGPFLAIATLDALGYEGLFGAGVAVSAAGLLLALMLRAPEREVDLAERRGWWRFSVRSLVEPAALRISWVILVAGLCYSGILTFLAPFTERSGLPWATTWFFVVYGIVVMLVRLVMGRVQDSRGDNIVVYPALASFALGLTVLALADSTWLVVASAVLIGLGFGALLPALQAIAVTLSPVHRLSTAVSTFYLLLDIGTGVGPLLLGLVLPQLGYGGMYLLLAGGAVLAAVIYFGVHGRSAGRITATG